MKAGGSEQVFRKDQILREYHPDGTRRLEDLCEADEFVPYR